MQYFTPFPWLRRTVITINILTSRTAHTVVLFSEVKYSDQICILCIWCLSETCVTIYANGFKNVVFSNLMLIWVSYCVNNHHMVAVVMQEESLKMVPKPVPEMCYDSICTVERVQQVSLNVMHHSEKPIKWRDCSASSILFRLRSIPFLET